MGSYEGMFILSPNLEGEQMEKEQDFIKNEIVKQLGEISDAKLLGKRRLAYSLKKMKEGIYLLINFASRPEVIDKLLKRLKLDSNILRAAIFVKGPGALLNEIKD